MTDDRLHTLQAEVLTGGTFADRRLHTEQVEVLTGGTSADRRLHTAYAEVLSKSGSADHRSGITTLWADVPLGADHRSRIHSMHIEAIGVGLVPTTEPEPTGLAVSVWTGTSELPANVSIWNGSAELPASVDEVFGG